MSELSYTYNISALSDEALLERIGHYIKASRLEQNKSQVDVATAANISRSTLSLLERGQTVTLSTLIQVLRVLDLLYVLNDFQVKKQISPMQLAEEAQNKRMRARSKKQTPPKKGDW